MKQQALTFACVSMLLGCAAQPKSPHQVGESNCDFFYSREVPEPPLEERRRPRFPLPICDGNDTAPRMFFRALEECVPIAEALDTGFGKPDARFFSLGNAGVRVEARRFYRVPYRVGEASALEMRLGPLRRSISVDGLPMLESRGQPEGGEAACNGAWKGDLCRLSKVIAERMAGIVGPNVSEESALVAIRAEFPMVRAWLLAGGKLRVESPNCCQPCACHGVIAVEVRFVARFYPEPGAVYPLVSETMGLDPTDR
jgi:hypothetical protein